MPFIMHLDLIYIYMLSSGVYQLSHPNSDLENTLYTRQTCLKVISTPIHNHPVHPPSSPSPYLSQHHPNNPLSSPGQYGGIGESPKFFSSSLNSSNLNFQTPQKQKFLNDSTTEVKDSEDNTALAAQAAVHVIKIPDEGLWKLRFEVNICLKFDFCCCCG